MNKVWLCQCFHDHIIHLIGKIQHNIIVVIDPPLPPFPLPPPPVRRRSTRASRGRAGSGRSGTEPARQAARAGAALRNRLKFTLGLLIGVQEAEKFAQSSPVSMQKNKASLHWGQISLHPRIRNSQKSLHWCKKSLHWSKKSLHFWWKSLHHLSKKSKKVHTK